MNDHLAEIAFVLDRSGSMPSMAVPAIEGFNRLLREHFSMTAASYGATQEAVNRKLRAVRRMKQRMADESTVRDAQAAMETLRQEEEDKDR